MDTGSISSIIAHLWLPVLAAAAAVWVASALAWMALPHHRRDWARLPDEEAFIEGVRRLAIPPGNYGFPDFGADCRSDEAKERWKKGPLGTLSIWNPESNMGKNMVLTFVVYLVVSALIAWLGVLTVAPGTPFVPAFRVFAIAGVLSYAFAAIPHGIWFQQTRSTIMGLIDGISYGLITGAVMAALWPGAPG